MILALLLAATFLPEGVEPPSCLTYLAWPSFDGADRDGDGDVEDYSGSLHPDVDSPYRGIRNYSAEWENDCGEPVTIRVCIAVNDAVRDENQRLPPHVRHDAATMKALACDNFGVSERIEPGETVTLHMGPMAEDRCRWMVVE